MTSIISLKKVRCKNCHKCIRSCPVKSIQFKDDQAQIMPEECILCGTCLEVCPQNAKTVLSDIFKIRGYIKTGATTVVSLAPSFVGMGMPPAKTVGILKRLGFTHIHETAEGALMVSEEYAHLCELGTMENIITTCCPTVNALLEKYYPDLIKYAAPVVSPMIAHGIKLRQIYGDEAKIIFVGPCISKKEEARDSRHAGIIDAVLSFEELKSWIKEEHIDIDDIEEASFENENPKVARLYPITSGIISTIMAKGSLQHYKKLSVDGIENCKEMLQSMRDGKIHGCFIEMNSCPGGCINGPAMSDRSRFTAQLEVEDYTGEDAAVFPPVERIYTLDKTFIDASETPNLPTEETIRSILKSIGKESPDDELNCGACGYPTCREKAIAVYQGKSELTMCLPYMKEMAQSLSNVILSVTPNTIMLVDKDLKICEFSQAAEKLFGISRKEAIGCYIYEFMDSSDFEFVLEEKIPILDKKVTYENLGVTVMENILYIPEQHMIMGLMKDVTSEENQRDKLYNLKMDTIAMAQKVIDKQMVVAQEIAGLLGETTAETKVTLSKLKDMIVYNEENGQ